MSQTKKTAESSLSSSPLQSRQNDVRTIICFAASTTVVANNYDSWAALSILDIILMIGAFVYTLATYIFLIKRNKSDKYQDLFNNITTIDAAVIGFILSFIQFSILPTMLFIIMIQFNSLINGGIQKWTRDNLVFVLGVVVTFLLWQPQWDFSNNLAIGIVSLIGVFTYFCIYAIHLNLHIKRLEAHGKKLVSEQVLHKLRTFKLSRYLTPTVWRAVNQGQERILKAERKPVTVFFSDIEGFTSLSEELESEAVTDILNNYLTEMTKIISHFGGNIDKFMGDGLMVLFGDSQTKGVKSDCVRCVCMAIQMRKKMKELQTKWYNQGIKKPLRIRMGISSGYCTVGTFGTNNYAYYTALGTHVNLASRLESASEAGEILISHETWSLVKDVVLCRDKGEINVKGFNYPTKVYQVVDQRKNLGKNQSYFEENAEGFSMHLDLDKIRNYDKANIIASLERVAEHVRDKII
ncbi:adenylate/guanylate cyclase domain-containing protein [Agarilytica rhodophyticola]|uniref:adenylate/guanylate cyclase domain-containing protein n=1 Tax=Agarilytica rhodophyticola TaxID=1737490 RepID=UPI000B343493|nr:adenylate/guanylate cyclase domain-containing protein [Agarilytica rhodophyticola]